MKARLNIHPIVICFVLFILLYEGTFSNHQPLAYYYWCVPMFGLVYILQGIGMHGVVGCSARVKARVVIVDEHQV